MMMRKRERGDELMIKLGCFISFFSFINNNIVKTHHRRFFVQPKKQNESSSVELSIIANLFLLFFGVYSVPK